MYNYHQPGLYNYDVWFNADKKGTLYFKAFEYTQNDELSKRRLFSQSSIKIDTLYHQYKLYCSKRHFMISEGDWEDPYAARFELWFKPDNGGKEIKIIEKIYKIEGWQR